MRGNGLTRFKTYKTFNRLKRLETFKRLKLRLNATLRCSGLKVVQTWELEKNLAITERFP